MLVSSLTTQNLQTNHIERLDAALLRPGRIDRKIQYKLATRQQALALFERFFPEDRFGHLLDGHQNLLQDATKTGLADLGKEFAKCVPENEFSTAQLQGYLLMCKMQPLEAALGVTEWIQSEQVVARAREGRRIGQDWAIYNSSPFESSPNSTQVDLDTPKSSN